MLKTFLRTSLPLVVLFAAQGAQARLDDEAALDRRQAFLEDLDLSRDHEFKHLSAGTTTYNYAVKDLRSGARVANLKCSSGNTFAPSAVAVYRLGRVTGFNIYPVAVLARPEQLPEKLRDQECVLKEWSGNFAQFNWRRDHLSKPALKYHQVVRDALRCRKTFSNADALQLDVSTRYGSFTGQPKSQLYRYFGNVWALEFVRDFANMMLVDAMIGNDDRFPGGNVHFRSAEGSSSWDSGSRVTLAGARLFSLDNEASMKRQKGSNAWSDYQKHVRAYDPSFVQALKSSGVLENAFEGLRTKDGRSALTMAHGNLQRIEEHLEDVEACEL